MSGEAAGLADGSTARFDRLTAPSEVEGNGTAATATGGIPMTIHICPGCQSATDGAWDEQRWVAEGARSFLCAACAGAFEPAPELPPAQSLLRALQRARLSPFNLTSLARPRVAALPKTGT